MSTVITDVAGVAERPADFVTNRLAAGWGLGSFATSTMLNGVAVVLLLRRRRRSTTESEENAA